MRAPLATAILAALCVGGLAAATFHYWRRDYFVSGPRTYASLKEAKDEGTIDRGWLPDFLPPSASNIHEKDNPEQNTTIACFSFDPVADLATVLRDAEELPASALSAIKPRRIGGREPWFPEAIFEAKLHKLAPPGFRLWQVRYKAKVGKIDVLRMWYLAINEQAGICYLWHRTRVPVRPPDDPAARRHEQLACPSPGEEAQTPHHLQPSATRPHQPRPRRTSLRPRHASPAQSV